MKALAKLEDIGKKVEIMEEIIEQTDQERAIEDCILSAINLIKKDRNRASYDNIIKFFSKRGFNVDLEELEEALLTLTERNLVVNKGKDSKESFCLVDIRADAEETVRETNTNRDDSNFDALKDFIDDKFYTIVVNKTKTEVKIALNESLHKTTVNNSEISDKEIISTLKKDIESLRNQIDTKDRIIELLIKDKTNDFKVKEKVDSESCVTNFETTSEITENLTNENNDEFVIKNKRIKKKRTITIIGDSTIKNIESYKMRQGMTSDEKVYIKSFPGAKVECMTDYIKPTLKFNPDAIILHIGTNDLRSEKSAEDIGNEILSLVNTIKTPVNQIIVSSIIARDDSLNQKGNDVNIFLKSNCNKNFLFCENLNISKTHLNGSGLHLNTKGKITLANNFLRHLNY